MRDLPPRLDLASVEHCLPGKVIIVISGKVIIVISCCVIIVCKIGFKCQDTRHSWCDRPSLIPSIYLTSGIH